MASAECNICE